MLRTILFFLIIALVFAVGCEPVTSSEQIGNNPMPSVRVFELPEPAIVGDVALCATDISVVGCDN